MKRLIISHVEVANNRNSLVVLQPVSAFLRDLLKRSGGGVNPLFLSHAEVFAACGHRADFTDMTRSVRAGQDKTEGAAEDDKFVIFARRRAVMVYSVA